MRSLGYGGSPNGNTAVGFAALLPAMAATTPPWAGTPAQISTAITISISVNVEGVAGESQHHPHRQTRISTATFIAGISGTTVAVARQSL